MRQNPILELALSAVALVVVVYGSIASVVMLDRPNESSYSGD